MQYSDPPPPYQTQVDDIYLPEMDLNAWPSSYYRRTRRIDLAKFYHEILKASSNTMVEDDHCTTVSISSSETSSEEDMVIIKRVTFSEEPPTVYEYEPEYDLEVSMSGSYSFFDDGWPGRTKCAMKSTGFIDFKSKIEAKLGAINDPSLISQLDSSNANVDESTLLYNQENSPLFRGYYRNRKSPLVQKLNLRPIPNGDEQEEEPGLMMDTPSPSNSYTDSPLTPKDAMPVIDMKQSVSSASSSNSTASGRWLKTFSRIRTNSLSRKR